MTTSNNKNQWKVTEEFNQQRVDYWLKKKITFISYPTLCKFIRKGIVRVNGKRIKNSSILITGDVVKFSRNICDIKQSPDNKEYIEKFSEYIQSLVIYKDNFSIVLNKPSGLAVQGGSKIKLNIDLMLDSLRYDNTNKPKLVHRIDKQTSGLLLIARSLSSSKYYASLFKNRLIDKIYLAIVYGTPKNKLGIINFPVGKYKKLESLSYFNVLDSQNEFSIMAIKPITGRKHQIRTHLNLIGNPIYGENKFLIKKPNIHSKKINLHLHAFNMKFKEQDNETREHFASLPEHFINTMKKFNFRKLDLKNDIIFRNLKNYKSVNINKDD